MINQPYQIVGHRGLPEKFPENSMPGLMAAFKAGANAVEIDIQLSRDGIPIVFHDDNLNRVTATKGSLFSYSADELRAISCHEPKRFGERFNPTSIITLEQAARALADCCFPDYCFPKKEKKVFIEIKAESFSILDRPDFLKTVLRASEALKDNRIIISFDADVLMMAKQSCELPIGWVIKKFNKNYWQQAMQLQPDYLICNHQKIGKQAILWSGPWQWFIYDITDKITADHWVTRGAKYIETWDASAFFE